jgi:hypothetical protein
LERSRAGTRRTNCSARSSGSVKVIFLVAILPYYHISHPAPTARATSAAETAPNVNLFPHRRAPHSWVSNGHFNSRLGAIGVRVRVKLQLQV